MTTYSSYSMFKLDLKSYKIKDLVKNKEKFEEIYNASHSKDGLFPCDKIDVHISQGCYRLSIGKDKLPVFPTQSSWLLCDYFITHNEIWNIAKLQVTYYYTIFGRAQFKGFDFGKTLEVALNQNKECISAFYHPQHSNNKNYSNIVFKIMRKQNLMQLEIWEYKLNSRHVYYMHALSEDNFQTLNHLDGATVEFSEQEVHDLLFTNNKIKGKNYSKIFRVDGRIDFSYLHDIAYVFLPLKDLYEEAFNIRTIEF